MPDTTMTHRLILASDCSRIQQQKIGSLEMRFYIQENLYMANNV